MKWSEVNLDAALFDLSRAVEWPPAPDVADQVRARTAGRPVASPPVVSHPKWGRRIALAAAAIALGVFGALTAAPGFRAAVADFLGLGRVKIETRATVPTPTTTAVDLGLGREASLDEVDELFGHVEVPGILGAPDTVYLSDSGDFVALVYDPNAELPEIADTGAGLIVFRLPDFPPGEYLYKTLGPDAGIRRVEVNGVEGLWVRGREHALSFEGSIRTSGNALIWEEEGVTFRIESMTRLEEVLEVARSLR